ncbi:hypothetical protein GCK32_000497 [Trichostrongylus colubriformis]|uniref:Uncharacterized protein n=1 Tax=Trichostrongylus colubriformis TaxID=6319 RepID=A0AAN8FM82_TRICO
MARWRSLGFDNYVVIRHGVKCGEVEDCAAQIPHLDVTAPGNSSTVRTLVQQCTVSRAGPSMIASGIAVELLSSVLQYSDPLRALANIDEPVHTAIREMCCSWAYCGRGQRNTQIEVQNLSKRW